MLLIWFLAETNNSALGQEGAATSARYREGGAATYLATERNQLRWENYQMHIKVLIRFHSLTNNSTKRLEPRYEVTLTHTVSVKYEHYSIPKIYCTLSQRDKI